MEASEILIENIKEEIPSILLAKFEAFEITTLASVLSIDLAEFSQRRGIGFVQKRNNSHLDFSFHKHTPNCLSYLHRFAILFARNKIVY